MNRGVIGAIFISVAAMLWAVDSAALRPKLFHLDPFIVVFLEHAIAFAFMFAFLMIEIKELKKLKWKDWGAFAWVALFGGAIGTLAITKAFFAVFLEGVSSVSVIVLLQKLQPVFAILLAMLILKERPRPLFWPLAGASLIGSYIVAFGFSIPSLSSANPSLIVPLLAIIAAFSFGSSTVFGKRAIQKVNFRVAAYIRFGLTSLILMLFIVSLGKLDGFSSIGTDSLLLILIIVFSSGGLAILLYYYGLKRVLASRATIYELAFPIAAIVLDYFLHDKVLGPGQWVGAIILIGSITTLTLYHQKKTDVIK